MSEDMLKKLLSPRERRVFIQEIKGTTSELTEMSHLLEKYLVLLEQIREEGDLTPIIERLERMEQWLIQILDKVDLTDEEQEVLAMLKTELSKK